MLRLRLTPSALLMFLILPALISLPAEAATFTVTNLDDSGSGSLRQAIFEANIAPGDDTIEFASGLNGTITLTSGELAITANLTINGPGATQLAISGNNQSRIFNISSSGVTVAIQGLTIKEGKSSGILNSGALTVSHSTFSGNSNGSSNGGAISNGSGSLTVNHSAFSGNSANSGGAISNGSGSLTVNHGTFSGNSASSSGGGIYNSSGALTVNHSAFSDNSASGANRDGGAIYNFSGSLTVNHSTFSGNSTSRNGGGIYSRIASGKETTITYSTLSGNAAASGGGGVYIVSSSIAYKATVTNSTFSGNSATGGTGSGGGIYNSGGLLTVINSTFSNNLAINYTGGGINNTNGKVVVFNSTLSGNSALSGGGIYSGGTAAALEVALANSIVAGNAASFGKEISIVQGTFSSQGYNLFGENGASGVAGGALNPNDLVPPGSVSTAIGPLADHGGPTLTHSPVTDSPAINAGNNSLIPLGIDTDQRGTGFPRILDNNVDIGAVEGVICPPVLVLEDRTVTGTETHEACTIIAGPHFTVTGTGDATFRAGQRITLRPGFRVQAGGRFRAQIDPGLAPTAGARAAATSPAPATGAPAPAAPPWTQATTLTWRELPAGLLARLREKDATVRDAQQSADGDLIVFATDAALVWNDDNGHHDVYAYAAAADALWLISATPHGAAAGPSHTPRLDGAGRHVIYLSTAADLVAGPSNEHPQIYHHDLGFGTTARLTRTAAGQPGAGASDQPLLAGDWAIYRTAAPDLAPEGPGLYRQHLHDGRREAVGLDDGSQPDPRASHPTADAAGAEIAYQRPDLDERRQIYRTALPWVERLSAADDPDLGPLDHCCAALSADGRYLAYREQGGEGPAWLHLRDRARDRSVRLPWPTVPALAEQAPTFRADAAELWWLAPEQGPALPEVLHRLDNPLREFSTP